MQSHLSTSAATFHPFLFTALLTGLWINASEIFRYFIFVMPMMRDAFTHTADIAQMNPGIFALWGVWDTILMFAVTGFMWIFLDHFGHSTRTVVAGACFIWMSIFVILWLGLFNMNLAPLPVLAVALPLALVEMIIAAFIVRWAMARFRMP